MAKKAIAPVKPVAATTSESNKQLVAAIVAVKQLQAFLRDSGSSEKAVAAVVRVADLVKITGGFDQLKEALEIVGTDAAPATE